MIGVEVGKEYAAHVLPLHILLVEPLQGTTTGIEEKCVPPGFDEDAWPESIHDRRGTTGTEESHLDVLGVSYCRNGGGNK